MNKHEDLYAQSKQQLDAYLDEHGLRHTQERYMLLKMMCELESPFTAEALVEEAKKSNISRATTYHMMDLAQKVHILHPLIKQFGDRKTQYEIVTHKNDHLQIVCLKCGRVADFKDPGVVKLLQAKKYSNFVMQNISLYVYGECKICRRKAKLLQENYLEK